jgi:hypothetical protein
MAPLTDPVLVRKFRETLKEWNCTGYIEWKRVPAEWLRRNLANLSQRAIGQMMWEHVHNGGVIDQVVETREEYRDRYPHHYDFRIRIAGRLVYIETCLDESDRMGPTVLVVSMHDA